ncbi:hypothetical protein H0H81_000369 [Sphagnurus paluster]|uniref:Uncharacterized protein n=1 Tax=Sphagnurus paluster TaxID=117069 RepID=A0A9P7KHV1_9AGAR|nr:hypothetical protein H0H81_000369 [Sphagnurus paluster]
MSNTHPPTSRIATEKAWDLFNEQRNQIFKIPILPERITSIIQTQIDSQSSLSPPEDIDTADSKLASIAVSLWRNKNRPSSSDRSTVESVIAQNTASNVRIMDEISGLQFQLNELLEIMKAKTMEKLLNEFRIDQCKTLMAPVRLLPPELLRKIFGYAADYQISIFEGFVLPVPSQINFSRTHPRIPPRLSSLVLMRVVIDSAFDLPELLDGCADLETFALYPATSSTVTPATILQICAAKHFQKLRKFTLAFFIRTAAQAQVIASGFADLLRAWTSAGVWMEGMDMVLYFCLGRHLKDLRKIEMVVEELQDHFRVGEHSYRINNLGFSFFFTVDWFAENDQHTAPLAWLER